MLHGFKETPIRALAQAQFQINFMELAVEKMANPQRIIVLLNLKPGKTASDYEQWARTTDLPTVNALASIDKFEVFKSTGLLGSTAQPPYAYVEILDIQDMDQFGSDVASPMMQKVAAEFQDWADPVFITVEKIGS